MLLPYLSLAHVIFFFLSTHDHNTIMVDKEKATRKRKAAGDAKPAARKEKKEKDGDDVKAARGKASKAGKAGKATKATKATKESEYGQKRGLCRVFGTWAV